MESKYPELKNIIEQEEKYMKQTIEQEFHRRENLTIKNNIKGITFFDFLDKNLAEIYLRNKEHMEDETLEELMKDHVKTYKARASHYNERFDSIDFEKRLNYRLESPLDYARQKLDAISSIEELTG